MDERIAHKEPVMSEWKIQILGFLEDVAERWREMPIITTILILGFIFATVVTVRVLLE